MKFALTKKCCLYIYIYIIVITHTKTVQGFVVRDVLGILTRYMILAVPSDPSKAAIAAGNPAPKRSPIMQLLHCTHVKKSKATAIRALN